MTSHIDRRHAEPENMMKDTHEGIIVESELSKEPRNGY
jgi:hypothetical protein